MKRALLAATAVVSTSFAPMPLITTAAQAANPTLADAQQVCNDLYVNNQADPSKWRAEVTDFHSVDGPSTQVAGSERDINQRPDTGGSFVYAGFVRADDPLTRTGGSVNMWGQSVFSQKIWDNTLYDVEADFTHTVTYYWTCHVEESVNHPVWVDDGNGGQCPTTPGNIQTGGNGNGNNGCGNGNGGPNGTSPGNNNGDNLQTGGNGNGNNGCGNGNGGPTGTKPNGGGGGPTGHWEDSYSWDFSADYTDNSQAGDDVDEGYSTIATDLQLAGHVDGVNYTEFGDYRPAGVRSLACINPGKKGGIWTRKNNYTGVNCTTAYFNSAPTAYGTTFDTITGTLPSASLPN